MCGRASSDSSVWHLPDLPSSTVSAETIEVSEALQVMLAALKTGWKFPLEDEDGRHFAGHWDQVIAPFIEADMLKLCGAGVYAPSCRLRIERNRMEGPTSG